jgi:hypothetical protein
MIFRLLLLAALGMIGIGMLGGGGVQAGPLPHAFVQNYTMHTHLMNMYPIEHPIWAARMGRMENRELKVCGSTCESLEGGMLTGNSD